MPGCACYIIMWLHYYVGNWLEVTGGVTTTYYYLGSQRVAMKQGAAVTYLFGDHLGSTSATTNASGGEIKRQLYYPYGMMRATDGLATDLSFTGQRRDDSTATALGTDGLLFYQARYYDPYLNRWTQPDNIIGNRYNPQNLNRYSYVGNNPVRYNDPNGHCWPVCTAAIGALVGGVVGVGSATLPQMIQNYQRGQPLTANIDPAKVAEATVKGALLGGAVGAAAGLVLPAAGAGTLTVTGGGAISAATAAACADGDCTNEVAGVSQAVAPAVTLGVPQITRASAAIEKFSNYIFKPEHGKDVIFKNLGYNVEDSAKLAKTFEEQALPKFLRGEFVAKDITEWGQRIEIVIHLEGIGDKAGKAYDIITGWMMRDDGSITLSAPFSGFPK